MPLFAIEYIIDVCHFSEKLRSERVEKFGGAWMIPKDAEKPADGRKKHKK